MCSDMQICTIPSRGGYVTGLVSTERDGVQAGVSRTFHDLSFPAHRAQQQLFASTLETMTVLMQLVLPSTRCQVAQF